jgi:hypothetical protein
MRHDNVDPPIMIRGKPWTPLEIAKLLAVVIVGAPLLAVLGLAAVWWGGF